MYQQFKVPEPLDKIVSFFYQMEMRKTDGKLQDLLPAASPVMGWQYTGNWRIKYLEGQKKYNYILPNFYIVGQQKTAYSLSVEGDVSGIIGAALKPDALWNLFKTDVSPFTQKIMLSETVFERFNFSYFKNFYEKEKTTEDRLKIVQDFFHSLVKKNNFEYHPAQEILKLIYREQGALKVHEISEELKMNERYLQRVFKKIVGLSCQDYIRIVRFNNIFTEIFLNAQQRNITKLAMMYNYYDKSHFYKDFYFFFRRKPSKIELNHFNLFRELVEKTPYLLEAQNKFQ